MPPAPDLPALVADIGGTNTRVALAEGRRVRAETIRRFPNAEFPGLEPVLRRYLDEVEGPRPEAVCVAVAGPVKDGWAELTNRDWTIDLALLTRATGARRAAILNDLQAQGHALGHLAPGRTRVLIPFGEAGPEAAKLVVNVGTGFNVALAFDLGGRRFVPRPRRGTPRCPCATRPTSGWPAPRRDPRLRIGRGGAVRARIVQVHDWLGIEEGDRAPATSAEIMAAVAAAATAGRRARRASSCGC
jgi:glucokinase